MSLVSDEEWSSFHENGYVKLEGVVPEAKCEAVVDTIWERLGANPDDPETWYTTPSGMDEHWSSRSGGMVELSHHQTLWETRQDPNTYQALAEIWNEEALWVSMDRCNMTPPRHPDHPDLDNSFLHWDADLSDDRSLDTGGTELPYGVQGVLYLDTVTKEQGTFQCVAEVYRNLREWCDNHEQSDMSQENYGSEATRVPGETGDLVIWDTRLPHGNGSNRGERPRFAQYISMYPARFADPDARARRIADWRELKPHGEDPSEWERRNFDPAELTSLGQKLLGTDPWPGWLSER